MNKHILAAVAMLVMLGGCTTADPFESAYQNVRPVTAQERAAVAAFLGKTLYKPGSLRGLSVANQLFQSSDKPGREMKFICLRSNGYAGTPYREGYLLLQLDAANKFARLDGGPVAQTRCSDGRLSYSRMPVL